MNIFSDPGFLILYIVFFIACLIHRWVCKSYYLQPRFNHPPIFWNRAIRNLLCLGPLIVFIVVAILVFFLTESPWWFLLLAFITLMITTPTVRRLS